MSSLVPQKDALHGLLHDATEAYLGDVISPLKRMLEDYQALEERWWQGPVGSSSGSHSNLCRVFTDRAARQQVGSRSLSDPVRVADDQELRMTITATRTYALMPVSLRTFEEISKKLRDAGYDQAFHQTDDYSGPTVHLDMQGLALCLEPWIDQPVDGVSRISQERARQISDEGYDTQHDDDHDRGELALAAALYATPVRLYRRDGESSNFVFRDPWPWAGEYDKRPHHESGVILNNSSAPIDQRIRQLEKAGALIAAEIDRLLRTQRENLGDDDGLEDR